MSKPETAVVRGGAPAARSRFTWLYRPLWFVVVFASACVVDRERVAGGGQHPDGWIEPKGDAFHGRYIAKNGFNFDECQACHGLDYNGGAVGVACTASKCHEKGPEDCETCHGSMGGPRPTTGAHGAHTAFCGECHAVPAKVRASGHMNGTIDVAFSGLAKANGAAPAWDPSSRTCSGLYCHVSASPSWDAPVSLPAPCDSCHGEPPASHARFKAVAVKGSCATCHPAPPDSVSHVNGVVDLRGDIACSTCHGGAPSGAPPSSLDGSTDASSPGVGAHRRHLDPKIADRIGRVAACTDCHVIPASVTAAGHLDQSAPADVSLVGGGSYDAAKQSCVVGCHWDRSPGPSWTDTSGAPRACDACHGFPPEVTRNGTAHTLCSPLLSECVKCHNFDPTTHVDNHVDFVK